MASPAAAPATTNAAAAELAGPGYLPVPHVGAAAVAAGRAVSTSVRPITEARMAAPAVQSSTGP